MNYELLYPGRFVKAADLMGKDVTKTIKAVRIEELEGEGGAKIKALVRFEGAKKEWVMPRTCGEALKLMFGTETDKWVGKRVTLFPTRVESFGEEVDAIRVRGSPDIKERMTAVIPRGRKTIKVDVSPTKAGKAELEPGSEG
jgi:hypothetical protein